MRVEQRSQLAAMQQLETRTDEELEAETKFKAAAQAILGARAAERYDAKAARAHFQRAIAAARPQERLQLRRMADASLALAERRADDLKKATERLGVEAPTNRQLRGLKFMGLVAPPKSAGLLARIRGIAIIVALVVAILAARLRHRQPGRRSPLGGLSLDLADLLGLRRSSSSRSACWPSSAGGGRNAPRRNAPSRSRRGHADRRRLAAMCGRYTLATPDPGGDPRPLSDRRVGRDPPALQRRAGRRRAGGDDRPRGAPARRAAALGPGAVVGQDARTRA